jgi:hypothetical protein
MYRVKGVLGRVPDGVVAARDAGSHGSGGDREGGTVDEFF